MTTKSPSISARSRSVKRLRPEKMLALRSKRRGKHRGCVIFRSASRIGRLSLTRLVHSAHMSKLRTKTASSRFRRRRGTITN